MQIGGGDGGGGGGGEGPGTIACTVTLTGALTVGAASTVTPREADSSEVDLEGSACAAVCTELTGAVSIAMASTFTEPAVTVHVTLHCGFTHPSRLAIMSQTVVSCACMLLTSPPKTKLSVISTAGFVWIVIPPVSGGEGEGGGGGLAVPVVVVPVVRSPRRRRCPRTGPCAASG